MTAHATFNGEQQVIISGGREIISADDFQAYWNIMLGAFNVHLDREAIRHGLWKDYPAEDQFNQIKIKIDRVIRSCELMAELKINGSRAGRSSEQIAALRDNILEEMADVINYATFGHRKVEGTA